MKIKLCMCLVLISSTPLKAENKEIKLDSKIEQVTVFLQGAQVSRTAHFSSGTGIFNLIFENVSPQIDPNTIQLSGKGDYIILNLQQEVKYPEPKEDIKLPNEIALKISKLEDSLSNLQFDIDQIQAQISTLEVQKNLISQNKLMTGEVKTDSLELFQHAMEYYKKKLFEINRELLTLKKENRLFSFKKTRMNARLLELQNFNSNNKNVALNKPSHRIVATIQINKPITQGKISVNYFVNQAGWKPSYDLRAENTSSPIVLIYKANVYQNSEENWDGVKLTLSSYQANRNTTKPNLPTWYLNYYNQVLQRSRTDNSSTLYETIATGMNQSKKGEAEKSLEEMDDATKSQMYSQLVDATTHVEYAMEIPYTIESGSGQQMFAIHQETVKAEYYHYLVPKLEKESFLLAQITNWEELNLLPATANIYFEGTYVGKTMINPQVMKDTLELAMGRDNRLICERKIIKDKNKANLIGPNQVKTYEYELIVRNNRTEGTQKLIIEDQIPVSQLDDIKVELQEANHANLDKLTGLLSWNMKLAAKESKKIKVNYTVKFDKDRILGNL